MLFFRSLRSGSSGNLLLLEHHTGGSVSRLLIDCGISSQRACRQILEEEIGLSHHFAGLLVTHAHSDHINYSSMRVIDRLRIPIYLHTQTLAEIRQRFLNPYKIPTSVDLSGLSLNTFDQDPFAIGGFKVTPIRVPHAPGVTTHAFVIHQGKNKVLIASDFNDPDAVCPHIYDCDMIYLEANYDQDLLLRFYNPASLFHMANPASGLLLEHAIINSKKAPRTIVLGHLSDERNRPELAIDTVNQALDQSGRLNGIKLHTAPRLAPGELLAIDE